jgi:NADH-quinone oxidoreductase subunit J
VACSIGAVIGGLILVEMLMVAGSWVIDPTLIGKGAAPIVATSSNVAQLGALLYTRYVLFFQAAGLVLLVAMIGAIVLTLRHKPFVKRQNVPDQVARGPATAIEIVSVETGKGI